ncbi:hypothetical protein APHAL10511_000010 [Amanita phalloides]|nr:hypothetical protein APHAL10511_000010 [Amanita phalloides]
MNPTFYHAPGHEALSQLKLVKEKHVIKSLLGGGFQVYRVRLGEKSLVVKEINLAVVHNWTEKKVQEEVRGADSVDKLHNAFFDGKRYFILTEDMGHEWRSGVGLVGDVARNAMEYADRWYAGILNMKRVPPPGVVTGYNDYAWTHYGSDWKAEPVGRWRFWKSTEEKPWVRNDIHYRGIKEWQGGLPIFATLDGTSEKAQG